MLYLRNKGFILFFVIFFVIVIFALAIFFSNRVSNTGRGITREMGIMAAQGLCEAGIAYAKKIIYENYANGNYKFYEELDFPVEVEHDEGEIAIQSISIYNNEDDEINYKLWREGVIRGEKDYLKIEVKGISSVFKSKLVSSSIICVEKVDYLR